MKAEGVALASPLLLNEKNGREGRPDMTSGHRLRLLIAGLGLTMLLGGCFEDQKRPVLEYRPGVYQGKNDSHLSPSDLGHLRQRAAQQAQPF
tara:strand:+ start:667 stop:942 length:276 start_codon:yes stop_codon:yes gene_type:complete